jgi:hypothetical protein
MKYIVVTENDIRKGFLIENLDVLTEARPEFTSKKVKQELIRTIEMLGGKVTLGELKTRMKNIGEAEIENNIYHLIYSHQLLVDLIYAPLNDQLLIERKSL